MIKEQRFEKVVDYEVDWDVANIFLGFGFSFLFLSIIDYLWGGMFTMGSSCIIIIISILAIISHRKVYWRKVK